MGKATVNIKHQRTTSVTTAALVAVLLLLVAAASGVAAQGRGGYGGGGGGGYGGAGGYGGGGYGGGGGGGYGYDGGYGDYQGGGGGGGGGGGSMGPPDGGGLSMQYYSMTCPYADEIVRDVVGGALAKDPTLAASLLRLHFHDCFVRGCDASVLLDSTPAHGTAEKDALTNKSLRGFEVIDAVKAALEAQCPGTVSCADVLALAARDSVYMAGGPYYDVPTGRKDGSLSRAADTSALPAATLKASELIKVFVGDHSFTVPELVALSGAHTLGQAHCANFKNRLSGFGKTGNGVDPTLEARMAASLARTCKAGGDGATAKLDATSNAFEERGESSNSPKQPNIAPLAVSPAQPRPAVRLSGGLRDSVAARREAPSSPLRGGVTCRPPPAPPAPSPQPAAAARPEPPTQPGCLC